MEQASSAVLSTSEGMKVKDEKLSTRIFIEISALGRFLFRVLRISARDHSVNEKEEGIINPAWMGNALGRQEGIKQRPAKLSFCPVHCAM